MGAAPRHGGGSAAPWTALGSAGQGPGLLVVAAGALTALWGLGRAWPVLWPVVGPFAAGAVVAAVLEPAVARLEACGVPRRWGAALCLGGTSLGAGAVLAVVVQLLWRELWRLSRRLPGIYALVAHTLQAIGQRAGAASASAPVPLRPFLADLLRRGYTVGLPLLRHLLAGVQRGLGALPDALFAACIALSLTYFLLAERQRVRQWLQVRLPAAEHAALARLSQAIAASVWGALRAQLLLAAATFGVSLLGLVLIGAPYALLAALLAALLDLLPIVGPALLFIPWTAGCLLTGQPAAGLALFGLLVAVLVVRWLLTPHILGAQVGLHPLLTLAAMYVGAHLAGLPGLVLGPLAAAALRAIG